MVSRRIYTKYKVLVHSLGLKQIDIYRVQAGGKEGRRLTDVVRVMDPASNKVAVIDLGTVREALSYTAFLDKLLEGLEKAGIKVSERRIQVARRKAEELDKRAVATAEGSG